MKSRDQTHPLRKIHIWDLKLYGNDKIRGTMVYTTKTNDSQTFHRQPIEFDVCQMRYLGVEFHGLLDQLEDKLLAARKDMKGSR